MKTISKVYRKDLLRKEKKKGDTLEILVSFSLLKRKLMCTNHKKVWKKINKNRYYKIKKSKIKYLFKDIL
jgi:hypothetical protein